MSDYIWYLVINTTHQKKGTCPRIYYRKITRYLVFRHIGLFPPSHAVFPPSRAVFPPSPAVFLPFACRFSGRRLPCFLHRVPSRAVLPLIARLFSAVACRVSARCLPCFCPLPAVFQLVACRRVPCFRPSPGFPPPSRAVLPPSPAVAYCASTHRPAFPAFNCHVSARRLPCSPHCLPSRAALPPIARLFSRRRLHCFIIKTKNCVCARNWHSECESVSRVHTLTRSHAHTLTRSHAHTLTRSLAPKP